MELDWAIGGSIVTPLVENSLAANLQFSFAEKEMFASLWYTAQVLVSGLLK